MRATITQCRECDGLTTTLVGVGSGKARVPGTGRLDCGHLETEIIGIIPVTHIVHLALSTLLRRPDVLADRDTAHMLQAWLKAPPAYGRTALLPWSLIDDYGVSSQGLATARILARTMSSIAAPTDAYYWRAAASIMRVRM